MPNNNDSTPDVIIHTRNLTPNIKDINLTNELCSDHLAITFNIDLHTSNIPPIDLPAKLNLNKTYTEKVKEQIENYIQTNIGHISIEDIHTQLSQAVTKHTPKIKHSFFKHTLPKYILRLIKNKRELYRLYIRTNDCTFKTSINRLNKDI